MSDFLYIAITFAFMAMVTFDAHYTFMSEFFYVSLTFAFMAVTALFAHFFLRKT